MNRTKGGRRSPKPLKVGIAEVELRPELQVREAPVTVRDPAVKRLKGAYRQPNHGVPPVKLMIEPGGQLVLLDGWHRITALRALGRAEVEYELVPEATPETAPWYAARANLKNGKQLRPKEFRRVFQAYISSGQNRAGGDGQLKSYRDIERDLGGVVSHGTIFNWMRELYPEIAAEMSGEEVHEEKKPSLPHVEYMRYVRGLEALRVVDRLTELLTTPERRGEFIVALEGSLARLRSLPHVLPPDPTFDTPAAEDGPPDF